MQYFYLWNTGIDLAHSIWIRPIITSLKPKRHINIMLQLQNLDQLSLPYWNIFSYLFSPPFLSLHYSLMSMKSRSGSNFKWIPHTACSATTYIISLGYNKRFCPKSFQLFADALSSYCLSILANKACVASLSWGILLTWRNYQSWKTHDRIRWEWR